MVVICGRRVEATRQAAVQDKVQLCHYDQGQRAFLLLHTNSNGWLNGHRKHSSDCCFAASSAACKAPYTCELHKHLVASGQVCVCGTGYAFKAASPECADINGCVAPGVPDLCSLRAHAKPGTCADVPAPGTGFTCSCSTGYTWNAANATCKEGVLGPFYTVLVGRPDALPNFDESKLLAMRGVLRHAWRLNPDFPLDHIRVWVVGVTPVNPHGRHLSQDAGSGNTAITLGGEVQVPVQPAVSNWDTWVQSLSQPNPQAAADLKTDMFTSGVVTNPNVTVATVDPAKVNATNTADVIKAATDSSNWVISVVVVTVLGCGYPVTIPDLMTSLTMCDRGGPYKFCFDCVSEGGLVPVGTTCYGHCPPVNRLPLLNKSATAVCNSDYTWTVTDAPDCGFVNLPDPGSEGCPALFYPLVANMMLCGAALVGTVCEGDCSELYGPSCPGHASATCMWDPEFGGGWSYANLQCTSAGCPTLGCFAGDTLVRVQEAASPIAMRDLKTGQHVQCVDTSDDHTIPKRVKWCKVLNWIHSEANARLQRRIYFDRPDGTPSSLTLSVDHLMLRLKCGAACKAAAPSVEQLGDFENVPAAQVRVGDKIVLMQDPAKRSLGLSVATVKRNQGVLAEGMYLPAIEKPYIVADGVVVPLYVDVGLKLLAGEASSGAALAAIHYAMAPAWMTMLQEPGTAGTQASWNGSHMFPGVHHLVDVSRRYRAGPNPAALNFTAARELFLAYFPVVRAAVPAAAGPGLGGDLLELAKNSVARDDLWVPDRKAAGVRPKASVQKVVPSDLWERSTARVRGPAPSMAPAKP